MGKPKSPKYSWVSPVLSETTDHIYYSSLAIEHNKNSIMTINLNDCVLLATSAAAKNSSSSKKFFIARIYQMYDSKVEQEKDQKIIVTNWFYRQSTPSLSL
jgi:hypothetical protein